MPKRGEIWFVLVDAVGNEIKSTSPRPVLVISPDDFNDKIGMEITLAISGGADRFRTLGLTVPLTGFGLKTTGVVRCEQVRLLDLRARNAVYVETVPDVITDEAVNMFTALIET